MASSKESHPIGTPAPSESDETYMRLALDEARAAYERDEVPIGAVVVGPGPEHALLARAHNVPRLSQDPTAHAELLAIRAATRATGYQRLDGCTLFVTIEPCFMCAGALVHARLSRVVFGARDPKFGGTVSLGTVLDTEGLNHRVLRTEGILADEARALIQRFFREKRAEGNRAN